MADRYTNVASGPRSPRFASSKFCAPTSVAHLVHRPRLFDRLDEGDRARLSLVLGSAGAGKTVLVGDWLATRPDRRSAWLTCDLADAEPVRFTGALIEALRRGLLRPDLGEDALQLLSLDGQVSADAIAALADDLEQLDGVSVLVIDDFHLTGKSGTDVLAQLLECRPASLQLVVVSRVDPALRLHRMRTNEELVELRERDLSFSAEETGFFLSRLGVRLSDQDVDVVHSRSEGWVAGLQMAAISIGHSADPGRAAAHVELQRHTVAGYFLDEVFYRQPADIVDFMLTTSILDELSVSACRALVGEGSGPLLERVFHDHLFVTVVDPAAGTYRYHQLIKEVLRAELHARDPEAERRLHATVADYLIEAGRVGPAARHLLAAGDRAAASRLLNERIILDFANTPTLGSALDLDDVQPEVFADAPDMLVALATDLLLRGAFERGSRAFTLAQRAGIDRERQPELAVRLGLLSSLYYFLVGRFDESLQCGDRVREEAGQLAGLESWLTALDGAAIYCHAYSGRFDRARELAAIVAAAPVATPPVIEVLCPGLVSQVALAAGALAEADRLAAGALDSARRLGFDRHYFVFTSLRTRALLALEHRHFDIAAPLIEEMLGNFVRGRPIFDYLAQLDRARVWAAAGNLDEALSSLPAARLALRSDRSPLLSQADELEARRRLGLGDRNGAMIAAAHLPDDRRAVVSVMVALGQGDLAGAEAGLRAGPEPGTIRSDLELRLLRASVALRQQSRQAPQLVRDALAIVDAHGFVQTVLDTSPDLVDQLVSNWDGNPRGDHLAALLGAGIEARKDRLGPAQPGRLPDPLTDAEVRVLELLPQRLTYADMASNLHLSLNTVKTHLRHTYMKLGVTSRSAAVKRAASLGFL